ncbi:MAG: FAD-dependent oxidoreductase [Verrucomicrobia bacterium]|nr:FAD-dependent oxidoreductase [Verrucomicrobiota bacterium]
MAGEVVIIGGGVIGLASAFACAQRGHRVTVLDKNPEGADSCSSGNAGMIVPSHFVPLAAPGAVALGLRWMWNPSSPFYIKPRLDARLLRWAWQFFRSANQAHVERSAPLLRDLSLASRTLFQDLARTSGNEFGLVERGLVMLCKTPESLHEEAVMAEKAQNLGVPANVLSASDISKLDPHAHYAVEGGVHYPKDCHLDPRRFLNVLRRKSEEMGVKIIHSAELDRWDTNGGRIRQVHTNQGTFGGDEFVLAAGSWTPSVAEGLGLRLPMQAGKGYSVTLPAPRRLPSICAILTEARVAVTPMGSALRIGGTMELAGMNESINPVRVQGIIRGALRYMPDLSEDDFAGLPVWRGLRPCTPDGLPYLGRVRRWDNLTVAAGHAMMGLSLAPITGEITARMIAREAIGFDLSLLDPLRFA